MRRTDTVLYLRHYVNSAIPAEFAQSDSRADEFLESEAGRSAVRQFQAEFGATAIDGVLGEKTLRAMQTPRCGCTIEMLSSGGIDLLRQHPNRNWKERPLLYGFKSFVGGIDQTTQRDLAREGTEFWMEACGIWIREIRSGEKAEVVLDTGRGRQDNFDGGSGTLAWAFVAGALMKFDLDENWTADRNQNGISWQEVFCHEFGHILGIGHLSDGNLMAPFYKRGLYKPQSGDAKEAQARYGKPTWTPDEPSDPTEPEPTGIDGTYRLTTNRPGVYVLRRQG